MLPSLARAHPVDSLRTIVEEYQRQENHVAAAATYLAIGEEYFSQFEHESALQYLQAGLESAEKAKNAELQFRILNLTGRNYFWMDEFSRAIGYHWKAEELSSKLGGNDQTKYISANLANIGENYKMLGNMPLALDYLLRAKDHYLRDKDTLGIAATFDKIGQIYWEMEQYDKALHNLRSALFLYHGADQKIYKYQIQASVAQLYKDMDELERAMDEAEVSLQMAESQGYQYGIALSTGLIGSIYHAQELHDRAIPLLKEAVEQFNIAGTRLEAGEYAIVQAYATLAVGQKAEALDLMETAFAISEEVRSEELKVDACRGLALVYQELGQINQALSYLSQYVSHKDSLQKWAKLRQASYLQTDYELRKRESQNKWFESETRITKARLWLIIILGSLLMLFVVVWLTYLRYLHQAKTSRLLLEKNEEIQHQNEALSTSYAELRRLSDLAAIDLREPVEGIRGELEQLYAGSKDEGRSNAYKRIGDHLKKLDALLAGILAFSGVRNDPEQWESIALSDVVKEAIRSLPEQERNKATRVQMHQLPNIRGDKRQLVQLFQHLLSNAIRFRGKEDPEVTISSIESGNRYLISVKDNGIGIPDQLQSQIFDLFFQGSGIEDGLGSGVGLAVSRRIVQQHGGKIWVSSSEGEGSTFYFTLPGQLVDSF